jgi:hypothetical protein
MPAEQFQIGIDPSPAIFLLQNEGMIISTGHDIPWAPIAKTPSARPTGPINKN